MILYLLASVTALAHVWSQPEELLRRAKVSRWAWTIGLVLLPFIAPVAYWMLIPARLRRLRRRLKAGGWPY